MDFYPGLRVTLLAFWCRIFARSLRTATVCQRLPLLVGSMGGLLKKMRAMRVLPKGTHFCPSEKGYPCSLLWDAVAYLDPMISWDRY